MKRRDILIILSVACAVACTDDPKVIEISDDIPRDPNGSVNPGGTGEALGPAGDYTQAGPWFSATAKVALFGRTDNELVTHIWYPSAYEGDSTVVYGWPSSAFSGEAAVDVAPDCSEPRPVMVHSHGNLSLNYEMFYLHEFLASHGWIVAAPNHTGNNANDASAAFGDLLERRPRDIQDTFDWLVERGQDPNSGLYGCIDASQGYVSTGYSFGGYTAYVNGGALVNDDWTPQLDYSDSRVSAVVTFAPWDALGALGSGTSEVDVPVLTIGGGADWTVGLQFQQLFSHVGSTPRGMATFPLAGHFSFTPRFCIGWGNGCGFGFVDEETFTSFVKTAVLAFGEQVRGREGALEQLPEESDSVTWSIIE